MKILKLQESKKTLTYMQTEINKSLPVEIHNSKLPLCVKDEFNKTILFQTHFSFQLLLLNREDFLYGLLGIIAIIFHNNYNN